jgi:hypothetical protein
VLRFLRGRSNPAPTLSPIARRVKANHLTYLNDEKLARIERAIDDLSQSGVRGGFVECGVALGGSGIMIATLMPEDREFHGYDYNDYGGCRRAVDEFIEAGASLDIVARAPNFVVRRSG